MYINITDSETGNNKGSSARLVQYLEKENRMPIEEGKEPELWFGNARRDIMPQEVRVRIDNNIAKLGRDDAKFFLLNISPSEKEIVFLKERFGEKGAEDRLKEFATRVMDAYAQNFRRPGIDGGKDLLWYGKLEHYRYYGRNDEEVKRGLAKVGQQKQGEQMHMQVIVSRKDISNKIKLSPMNNSRGKNEQHSAKLGQFDRVAFKGSGEVIFDGMFGFERAIKDTMAYAIAMNSGTAEQKRSFHLLEQAESSSNNAERKFYKETAGSTLQTGVQELEQMIGLTGSATGGLLDILMQTDPLPEEQNNDIIPIRKKKRKPGPRY